MPRQFSDCNGGDSPPYELECDGVMSNIRGRGGGYLVDLFDGDGTLNVWTMCTYPILLAPADGEGEEEEASRADEAVNAKLLTARRELACALRTLRDAVAMPMKADKGTVHTDVPIYACRYRRAASAQLDARDLGIRDRFEGARMYRTACACCVVGGGRGIGKARIFHRG